MRAPTLQYVSISFVFIVGLTVSAISAAAEKLYVQNPASYAQGAEVASKVKAECQLEEKVGTHVAKYAAGNFEVVSSKTLSKAGGAKALGLSITHVLGVGGGAWSGAKSITVKGTLKQGGKVMGTFEARRSSGGGAFGAYKGTCSILGRCAKALGKDIASWLESPSMNARLGELK